MDNVLLDSMASAAGTQLAFSNGWRYGAPILPGTVTMEHLWNIAAYFTRASWKNFLSRSGDFSNARMCLVAAVFNLALVRTGSLV